MFKPELLSPAGSLEKLKVSVSYGADAIYLAGQKFGLRTAAENFTLEELQEGIAFAHAKNVKVFVVLNGFLHDSDLAQLPIFVRQITELGADAVIASDLGVIVTVKKNSKIPIHLSTQASCLNLESAKMWAKTGVHRLILGREVLIEDAGRIKKETGLEVELFIHGSMCMAYSGNCTISNYTQGRDSNRGGCAQSCRFKYSLETDDGKPLSSSSFMSSKDLFGLELLPLFVEHEIDSLKVEGRMRSPLYAGIISRVYREAIDHYLAHGKLAEEKMKEWVFQLSQIPNRTYTEGNLKEYAGMDSVNAHPDPSTRAEPMFLGLVQKIVPGKYALVEARAGFDLEDTVELVSFSGQNIPLSFSSGLTLQSATGQPLSKVNPNSLVRIPYFEGISTGQILRKLRTS